MQLLVLAAGGSCCVSWQLQACSRLAVLWQLSRRQQARDTVVRHGCQAAGSSVWAWNAKLYSVHMVQWLRAG